VGDVTVDTDNYDSKALFGVLSAVQVSPNNALFCPLLSRQGLYFSRYRWKSVRIEYVPRVSTSTTGTVAIGFSNDPDASLADGTSAEISNLSDFMQLPAACNTPAWQPITFSIPSQWLKGPAAGFLMQQPETTSENLLNYFPGVLYIGVDGYNGTGTLGSLRVHYEVELLQLTSNTLVLAKEGCDMHRYTSDGTQLMTELSERKGRGRFLEDCSGGDTLLFRLPGQYLVHIVHSATSHTPSVGIVPGFANEVNCTPVALSPYVGLHLDSKSAGDSCEYSYFVTVKKAKASFEVDIDLVGLGLTNTMIYVLRCSDPSF